MSLIHLLRRYINFKQKNELKKNYIITHVMSHQLKNKIKN